MPRDQAQSAPENIAKPIVWSIAGNDSGGGAGLSADARAAAAFGVHLCPVVAAVTAQNSVGVTRVAPVAPDLLDAQLAALAADMPPAVIKTGLLGSADNIAVVARWVDRLRARAPLALVVDPVLGASTGAAFADDAVLRAYRDRLLPRATLVTPNAREARRLVDVCASEDAPRPLTPTPVQAGGKLLSPEGRGGHAGATSLPLPAGERVGVRGSVAQATTDSAIPALAQALRAMGSAAVAITGGDSDPTAGWSLDWIDTARASGWLALPRVATRHTHGTGCTFASSAACALALGFVAADALVLAKMATTHALRHGHAAGQGAGPVAARAGFATQPDLMPLLSWDDDSCFDSCLRKFDADMRPISPQNIDLYAIVDSAGRVQRVVAAGVRTVQLRIKTPDAPDAAWHAALRAQIAEALGACQAAGATLVVNDHWRDAAALGAPAVHLGQEDLLALGEAGRAALAASGLQLGISSHSLWELARARALRPWYAACGPVWPTLTKAMPWRPQGLDNLAWWVRMAGLPVVAIGGILETAQLAQAAQSGAAGVCVVRGLGDEPAQTLPGWSAALRQGRTAAPLAAPPLPHSSLEA